MQDYSTCHVDYQAGILLWTAGGDPDWSRSVDMLKFWETVVLEIMLVGCQQL